jgi:sulfur transfer complex TusBCD TusB component (DsrH family)
MAEGGDSGVIAELFRDEAGQLVVVVRPLLIMLDGVAMKSRDSQAEKDAWVKAMDAKLQDVGVLSLREFVMKVVVINKKLIARGHQALHETELMMMMAEVCDMVMGPEESALLIMLEGVAIKSRGSRAVKDAWVKKVDAQLRDVGVLSLPEFVMKVVVINKMLIARGHQTLQETVLMMMMAEVCDLVLGPQESGE